MVQILSDKSSSYVFVKKWTAVFKQDRKSIEYDPQAGRPETSTTDKHVDPIPRIVFGDRLLSAHEIAKSLGIRSGSIHTLLNGITGMYKRSARWQSFSDWFI